MFYRRSSSAWMASWKPSYLPPASSNGYYGGEALIHHSHPKPTRSRITPKVRILFRKLKSSSAPSLSSPPLLPMGFFHSASHFFSTTIIFSTLSPLGLKRYC